MKNQILKWAGAILLPVVILAVASCSSTDEGAGTMTHLGIKVNTHRIRGTVAAIGPGNHELTLTMPDGKRTNFTACPVVNFPQIQVGDKVKAMVTGQVVVYMATNAFTPIINSPWMVVLDAGAGTLVAGVIEVNATVTDIDLNDHRAAIQFPDGSTETFAVRGDVDLTKRTVGEQIFIGYTEAFAISVKKL